MSLKLIFQNYFFKIVMTGVLFFAQMAFAQKKQAEYKDIPYLTYEEFQNLYEADQFQYIKLVQKIAVEFSFNTDYVAQQKWPSIFNILQSVQQNAEANSDGGRYTPETLRAAFRTINARAEQLARLRPTQRSALDLAIGGFFGTNDVRYQSQMQSMKRAFEARNMLIRELSTFAPELQEQILPVALAGQRHFDALKNNTARIWRANKTNEELVELDRRYGIRYRSIVEGVQRDRQQRTARAAAAPTRVQPAAGAASAARSRTVRRTGTLVGPRLAEAPSRVEGSPLNGIVASIAVSGRRASTDASAAVSSDSTSRTCVRCVYGGFPIINQQRCRSVSSLADETHSLGAIQLPSSVTNRTLACESSTESVLCNPLIFGLKDNGPLCVRKSSSATRSCLAASGKDQNSLMLIREMIFQNRDLFLNLFREYREICRAGDSCTGRRSAAKTEDIRQTCRAMYEQVSSFRESMRSLPPMAGGASSADPSAAPSTSDPASAPNPSGNGVIDATQPGVQ